MNEKTLLAVEGQAARVQGVRAELEIEERKLDRLLEKARKDGWSAERIAARTQGLMSGQTVLNRTVAA